MDVLITVRGKASCMIVCDPVDVTCAIIQDATIAKIRECLGDRISEVCEGGGPCAPLNYSLRDTDGNILLSGIEQNPCGNELPLIAPNGTVTRDGLPFGSVLSGGTLDVPSDCPPCNPLTITINEEEAALIEDPCGETVPFIVVDRNSIVVPVTLNRGTIIVDDLPCPPTTVNGAESDTPTITVLKGGVEVGTLNPATGVHTVPECDTLCDLLGDVEPADVQAQILDCVTEPSWIAIRIAQICDRDAQAYLARVEAADGDYLEQPLRQALCDLVLGLKADGIWTSIVDFVPLVGARTLDGGLIPLKGYAPINFGLVAGDYARKTGVRGNGSSKYINTRRALNDFPQNDIHASLYVSVQQTLGVVGAYIGAGANTQPGAIGIVRNAANQIANRNRNNGAQIAIAPAAVGFTGHTRNSGTGYSSRVDGVDYGVTQASQTPDGTEIYVLAQSALGGGGSIDPFTFTDGRINCYTLGTSINLATLQNRVDAYVAAVNSIIP
jgi:hypothetical protein